MADEMDDIVDNLRQPASWIRVVFMIGFAILLYVIIAPVIFVLMLVQALFVLISGEYNANLRYLGATLGQYVLQILQFISYNSEVKPFPFTEFPSAEIDPADADDQGSNAGETDDEEPAPVRKAAAKKSAARRKAPRKKSAAPKGADSSLPPESNPES